jgi:hypothetical protein
MTPEQWLAKHYPVPASELAEAPDEECLLHCINKWEGAKEENLPEGMEYKEHCVGNDGVGLIFDYDTCALCMKYGGYSGDCEDKHGKQCSIVRMHGFPCYPTPFNHMGIYEQSENDPAPMIDLLKRTLEFVRAGG